MQRSESQPLALTPGPEVRGGRERAEKRKSDMSRTHNALNEDPMALPPGPEDEDEAAAAEALEASFQTAFQHAGGAAMLAGWAQADPARFFALLARRLPAPAPAQTAWADISNVPLPELTEEEWVRRFASEPHSPNGEATP